MQFQAVQCQHERCVRLLLENHADPNLVDIDDNTALHLAANIPSISTAVLLLEHDADIDSQNKVTFLLGQYCCDSFQDKQFVIVWQWLNIVIFDTWHSFWHCDEN